jgi:hypothetical protein
MKITATACVLIISLAAAGCATTRDAERPDWIMNDTAQYSSERYLLGRGQADTLDGAKDRARADLAKTFSVNIVTKSSDVQRFQSGMDSPQAASPQPSLQQDISQEITTSTDQLLRGVTVAETWQDPATKSFYALATLSRIDASRTLRRQLADIDTRVQAEVQAARESGDLLQRIDHASRAVRTHAMRDGLGLQLAVIDRGGRADTSPYNTAELEADLAQLLGRVNIVVGPRRDEPGQDAHDLLSAAVTTAGFQQDASRPADYSLTGGLLLDPPKLLQGVYWVTGSLQMTLRDPEGVRVRGSKRWPVKGGSSVDGNLAERKARDQAQTLLNGELNAALVEFSSAPR